MGLHHHHHRKLMPLPEKICGLICHVKKSEPCSSDCKVCLKICLTNPQYPSFYYSPPPPQVPPFQSYDDVVDGADQAYNHKISTYLFLALALLTAAFFVVSCRAIYTRFSSRRRVSSPSTSRRQTQTHHDDDDFVDDEEHHGRMVDHPIWYIRTLGLQQSIINAITVCKYKKGEGLIEGTDCAVCLSEFQEDENLRLLPKCQHAFHLPCIDTWLRSHTNCPMCRAPIVAEIESSSFVDSNSLENSHMEVLENSAPGGSELMNNNRVEEVGQLEEVVDDDGVRVCETETPVEDVAASIRPRRSFSLDSFSVANFNLALATAESYGNSKRVQGGVDDIDDPTASKGVIGNYLATSSKGSSSFRLTRYLQQGIPSSSVKRSQSFNGKYLLSRYGRSQKKPNAPLRSF
ncbi:hypothetical protein AAZX31_08G175100 [Glycine max]|uniref:RING-type E3 ubiquitin transferase n=1 Tax=Glycine max TaxID=3847 RepID=I1KUB3_SOYBN|nr:RING-H2 finger protein ATL54 [Glycine max]KAG5015993.1 hypothetical protein JHK85_022129 [Glycine max]KAG5025775.1 hypothetical protein JHK86_021689 [Glycine max]KAG5136937.1 hypothetical protein JHK82_021668 [Glycine max]KAH1051759.1 hypothetical protein GYH30_021584 [Glycine max]KAH1237542.1 RING-H2 finger protein ATL54 [Glycine max]|eukprot:XP_003531535.1 RING-H2 finger protein ATL54 [Glycine max]